MTDPVAIGVSVLALAVSSVTAWLTLLRSGTVKMTQPTMIVFGWDVHPTKPKVYLRTLLFATAKRGRIVESMHVSLVRAETHQNFNFWVLGETGKLSRGSGVFVGESGVTADHHFMPPLNDDSAFEWRAGKYRLGVHARLLGESASRLLFSQDLDVTPEFAKKVHEAGAFIYFNWATDSATYMSYLDAPPAIPAIDQFISKVRTKGS